MTAARKAPTRIAVTVELFGNARLLAGRQLGPLKVPDDSTLKDIAEEIGRNHPTLAGTVVREDLTGFLDSYTVNLNGVEFIDERRERLNDGDVLLVFSSQAGG